MRIAIGVVLMAVALAAAEPQTRPFGVGVLRRDGVIIPFAAYDGKRWSAHWPAPGTDLTVPINLPSLPSRWWGPTGALDTWTAWPGGAAGAVGGESHALHVIQPDWVDTHCVRQIGLRTDYKPEEPPPPRTVQPYPKDGLAVSPAQPVEPIVWLSSLAPELEPLGAELLSAFNRAERSTAGRFEHPVEARRRESMKPTIEAVYALGTEPRLYYVEAVRQYEKLGGQECQVVAFGTGWFLRENGKFRSMSMAVDALDCDRSGASYMLPLGAVRLGTRLFWLVQFSGWDHERYVVIEPKLKAIDAVLSVWGGGC
jgi:hypothetical protein